MKKGNKVVFGIYRTRDEIDMAIIALRGVQFRSSDVSVLMPPLGEADTLAHIKSSKAPEGAMAGLGLGAVLGGAFGWLAGVGGIAVAPPLGILIAAGPIMSALAAAAAGGAVGSVAGALVGLGIPEYVAERYEDYVEDGGMLLSVHADDEIWMERARKILEETGARDISTSTEIANVVSLHQKEEEDAYNFRLPLP